MSNERLAYSAKVVNHLLTTVPVYIDPSCRRLHYDLETAKRTQDGGLLKDRKANPQDAGDAFRYLVHAMFPGGITEIDRFAALIGQAPEEPEEVFEVPEPPKKPRKSRVQLDESDFL